MAGRQKLQSKLLVAFLAVGLLSIIAGVFVPLRIVAWLSPRESQAVLSSTQAEIARIHSNFVEDAQEIGRNLKNSPDFRASLEAMDTQQLHELLREYAMEHGYSFMIIGEEGLQIQAPVEPRKRFVRLLRPNDELLQAGVDSREEWQGDQPLRLLPLSFNERIYYLSGAVTQVQDSNGNLAGGLLVGHPLIVKNPKLLKEEDYPYDKDYFPKELKRNVSLQVFGVERQRFWDSLKEQDPTSYTQLHDHHQTVFLPDAKFANMASQILLIPVEDSLGNLISVIFLYVPLPPATHAWRALTGIFYYGVMIAIVLAFLMAYFVARTISHPIRDLSAGATAWSRGDLDHRVEIKSRDEVGELARTFEDMRSRLKQTMEQLQVRAKTIEEKNVALDQSLAEISRMRDFTEDVLSSIDGGVITFGLNARVTKINEAARRILGLDSEDSSSQIPPVIVNIITEVMTSGRRVEHEEMEVDRPDGTKVPIDLSVSFLKSQERNIGVVATFYDLTQVRALQERVRRQEHLAALGTLSAGIAHEIRNPLGIIKGAAEILQKRFGQHEDEEGLSGFIIEEVKRLSTVVTEFLDFARPKEPHFRPCSLNDVIKRSLRVANLPAVHPKVQTELELDQLPQAEADPEQCQQALINLILNAAQAMPEGGGLCIRSRHEADNQRVIIEVMDTGQGIDSETRSRIFNPFFTTKDEGTGLGLSIVHRIVENHKAHISVESTPGEGCTFRIAFPVNLSPEEENLEGMQNTAASSNIEAS